jgi:hypothetical protein
LNFKIKIHIFKIKRILRIGDHLRKNNIEINPL